VSPNQRVATDLEGRCRGDGSKVLSVASIGEVRATVGRSAGRGVLQDPATVRYRLEAAQDSFVTDGRPGLRMATPAFNRAWRIVSGLTWSSLPIEEQERPEA
jgi:hypothetical protein